MNLSSLSNDDLELLHTALMNIKDDNNEEAMLVYGQVAKEIHDRKTGERSMKTGYQIELLENGKWKPIDKTYFSIAIFSQFYATKSDAQQAVNRINTKIRNKYFESASKQIKPGEYRFRKITTIHEIA